MITKKARVVLTREEVSSPEKIRIIFSVGIKGKKGSIDYTIEYPKNLPKELPLVGYRVLLPMVSQ